MFFAFLASLFGVDEIEGITVDEIVNRAQLHNSCNPLQFARTIMLMDSILYGFHRFGNVLSTNT